MLLSEFKKRLEGLTSVEFKKLDGSMMPKHFHITELGQIDKRYIDCGGTIRNEKQV